MDAVVPSGRGVDAIERQTIRRVAWRLIPLVMIGYFCAYLDRANVGMAGTTMVRELGFSSAVFGFGSGLFSLGYLLAEVPSNLVLAKVGARRWLARILVTWGIISGLTGLVWNDWSFYGVRFLLGLAEAGFFPGVVLYLTWWFPSYYRARMQAIFQSASVISMFIGPPVGGLLLNMNGILGLAGWRWLFLIEALPAVIMSVVTWQMLTNKPADATWLRPDQKAWLIERLASEDAQREVIRKFSLGEVFYNPKVWLLTVAYGGGQVVSISMLIFLPLIIKGLGTSTNMIGVVSALPYLVAFVVMNLWGRHSDRTGERTWHAAGAYLLTAAGAAGCVVIGADHPMLMMVSLTCAVTGVISAAPPFWALPSALLTGTAAAGGLAMINAIAGLGGWFGPSLFGLVKDATGSDNIALLSLALAPALSAVAVVVAGHDRRMERIPPRRATR